MSTNVSHMLHKGMMSQQFKQCDPPLCLDVFKIPVAILTYGNPAQYDSILVPPSHFNGQVLVFIFPKQCLVIPMVIVILLYFAQFPSFDTAPIVLMMSFVLRYTK